MSHIKILSCEIFFLSRALYNKPSTANDFERIRNMEMVSKRKYIYLSNISTSPFVTGGVKDVSKYIYRWERIYVHRMFDI